MGKKMPKEHIKTLMAIADMQLAGTYHTIYKSLGVEKGPGQNFHCFNKNGHSGGCDSTASLGIDNENGRYHCFSCDISGNLFTFWNEYVNDNSNEYYHEFLMNDLGIKLVDDEGDTYTNDIAAMKELYNKMANKFESETGKKHVFEENKEAYKDVTIPHDEVDANTKRLLDNPEILEFLEREMKVTPEMIKKYKLGFTDSFKVGRKVHKAIMFPVIFPDGDVTNYKCYMPHLPPNEKWRHLHRGRNKMPAPIDSFANDVLYFFEGEPDTYCASGFGIKGAVTLGSASDVNLASIIGDDLTEKYLQGKEVVICFDCDESGRAGAKKMAALMYPFARQIKIINFAKSEENTFGIDTKETKIVGGKKKQKFTDFRDFMKLNGFGDSALERFNSLVTNTSAYTDKRDRGGADNTETYKVTVQECRMPKYHSEYNGVKKRVELVASIADMDHAAYMYYEKLPVECAMMGGGELQKKCKYCMLPLVDSFKDGMVEFHFDFKINKKDLEDPTHIRVTEKDILETIEVNEKQKNYKLKQLTGVNSQCTQVRFREGKPVKVTHAKLIKDMSAHTEVIDGKQDNDIDVDAYIVGANDVQGGRSYRMKGVQTTTPDGQYVALFIDSVEPVMTSIEQFDMSNDIHNELAIFRPKGDETVHDALWRRYDEYSDEARLTGRNDLFFMYDLAIFSSTDFNSTLISKSVRKWVEVGVIGESRCGKSIAAEALFNKYRIGEYLECSTAVSRSGIIGGIAKQLGGKNKIAWGIIPRNDKSVIAFDEVSNMSLGLISDMTPSRTSGVVNIEMTVSGKALARTRKVFISNARDQDLVDGQQFEGMTAIKNLYGRDEIIQRFDLMTYIKSSDVDKSTFKSDYTKITNDFTDLNGRHLLMWAHSRKPNEFVFEGGDEEFNSYVREKADRLHKLFHDKTLLVGQESNVRIIRLSVSLACLMYSTVENDFNKVLVKLEHVDAIVDLMIHLYTSPNMRFNELSEQIRASETLGDMRFMENIVRYIDPTSIIRESSFTDKSFQQVFQDYLDRVSSKKVFMVDAADDSSLSTGQQIFNASPKLAQTMVSRNCLVRNKNRFEKTPMFTTWLDKIRKVDKSELSNILEYDSDQGKGTDSESASNLIAQLKSAGRISGTSKK